MERIKKELTKIFIKEINGQFNNNIEEKVMPKVENIVSKENITIERKSPVTTQIAVVGKNKRILTILIEFSDRPFTKTATDFDKLMNQESGTIEGNVCSVRNFYWEDSYGRLNVTSRVVGPFKANFKKATLLWLLQLTLGALLAVNLYAAWNFYLTKGIIALGFLSLSGCAALVAICCSVYIYPILAAYDFPVKKILMDSFIMATGNLHVTISVLVLFLLAAVGIYYFGGLFFFWIGLAIFFSSYFI